MQDEDQEFSESLQSLTDEIQTRVREVGLKQAAEEYWNQAKTDLHAWFVEKEEFRREHNLPEDEL
jgi:hypothetical protein